MPEKKEENIDAKYQKAFDIAKNKYFGRGSFDDKKQEGLNEIIALADSGYIEAQAFLGTMYRIGVSLKQNLKKAFHYTTLAATGGDCDAQRELADFYYEGKITKKDTAKAIYWYEKCLAQKEVMRELTSPGYSANQLGIIYMKGQGVEKNDQKAFDYFKQAGGNCKALYYLGNYYEKRIIVPKNLFKAYEHYENGAGRKYAPAMKAEKRLRKYIQNIYNIKNVFVQASCNQSAIKDDSTDITDIFITYDKKVFVNENFDRVITNKDFIYFDELEKYIDEIVKKDYSPNYSANIKSNIKINYKGKKYEYSFNPICYEIFAFIKKRIKAGDIANRMD